MDEKPKKSSLRGRGREIMRGLNPKPQEQPEESPQFEDETDFLNWMEEVPDEEPPPSSIPIDEDLPEFDEADLYAEPDFDAIFAESDVDEDTLILEDAPASTPPELNLESVFDEPEATAVPSFNALFGDVIRVDDAANQIAIADDITLSEGPYVAPDAVEDLLDFDVPDEELADVPTADSLDEERVMDFSAPEEDFDLEFDLPDETDFSLPEEDFNLDFDLDDTTVPVKDFELPEEIITEPLELDAVPEAALPEPLPNSERDTAFGLGASDSDYIEESFDGLITRHSDAPTPRADRRSAQVKSDEPPQTTEQPVYRGGEAVPQGEGNIQPVDLKSQRLNRGVLAGITPSEPEVMDGGTYQQYMDEEPAEPEIEESIVDFSEVELPEEELIVDSDEDDTAELPEEDQPEYNIDDEEPTVYDFGVETWEEDLPEEAAEMDLDISDLAMFDDDYMAGLEEAETTDAGGYETDLMEEEVERSFSVEEAAPPADPFRNREVRRDARDLFQPDETPSDKELLDLFVDDARMRELFNQIDALQEEVATRVQVDRSSTDTYQQELLQASNMLTRSREYYDEARAIVYRVRADLNREKRIEEDIAEHRPRILVFYGVLFIIFIVMLLISGAIEDFADNLGNPWLGESYFAAVFGYLGAILFGALTVIRRTSVERNFDPNDLTWYYLNPLLGLLTGFLVYLFVAATVQTSVNDTTLEVDGRNPLLLLLSVAAGANQNILPAILGSAWSRFGGSDNSEGNKPLGEKPR
jgi:hypothetical protein